MWFQNDMLGTMWSRNYTSEVETFVMWSQGGVKICLFLLDRTARMDTKKVSTCQGSFGGFKTTCFQLDRAASFETTGISYFSCDRSPTCFFSVPDYGRDKLLTRAINLIVVGWRSSGLPAWESIVFIYHTSCSLAPHMTSLLAFGARARTT